MRFGGPHVPIFDPGKKRGQVVTGTAIGTAPSAAPGHPGVAAWVAANLADVLAYYKMDDVVANGTMTDYTGNGRHGTYRSGATATTIDGEDVQEFNAAFNTVGSHTDYASWMDGHIGTFCVSQFPSFGTVQQMVSRDGDTERSHQFRMNITGGVNANTAIIRAASPQVTLLAGSVAPNTRTTMGWWWDGTTTYSYVDGASSWSAAMQDMSVSSARMTFGFCDLTGGETIMSNASRMGSVVILGAASASTMAELHDAWVNGY